MIHPRGTYALLVFWISGLAACAGQVPRPEPRPIVVYSGERILADGDRMAEIEAWLTPELERINLDPEFLIRLAAEREVGYPWDTIEILGDTVDLSLVGTGADAESPYLIYGYLRLLDQWGTLVEVLPEAQGESGYGVEKAILTRVAEVWLLGRSVFDTAPFGPLDELVYAAEFDYLDEFIFATQGDCFSDAAGAYAARRPGRDAEFRSWFRRTFDADGPRFILSREEEEVPDARGGDRDSAR